MLGELAALLLILGLDTRPNVFNLRVILLILDDTFNRVHWDHIALRLVFAGQEAAPCPVETNGSVHGLVLASMPFTGVEPLLIGEPYHGGLINRRVGQIKITLHEMLTTQCCVVHLLHLAGRKEIGCRQGRSVGIVRQRCHLRLGFEWPAVVLGCW